MPPNQLQSRHTYFYTPVTLRYRGCVGLYCSSDYVSLFLPCSQGAAGMARAIKALEKARAIQVELGKNTEKHKNIKQRVSNSISNQKHKVTT